tara:strand:+ start:1776 stop:2540 length:765 start_codon:yes stop_codon:yes gene_type:complete
MICVKYEAGCLGNFLCHVLIGYQPKTDFNYGLQNKSDILHTGAFANDQDTRFLRVLAQNTHKIISHNTTTLQNFIDSLQDTQTIFIDLNSNFVEYRLNYMLKMPHRLKKQNNFAEKHSWKGYNHAIAFDDARRIIRLHKNEEQVINKNVNDVVFNFANFYLEKYEWITKINNLAKIFNLDISEETLELWHSNFILGQNKIIERSKLIYDCILNKRFVHGLTENEKGIIIGYNAFTDKQDNSKYFEDTYRKYYHA